MKPPYIIVITDEEDWKRFHPQKLEYGWILNITKDHLNSIGGQVATAIGFKYDRLRDPSDAYYNRSIELYSTLSDASRFFTYIGRDSDFEEDHWTSGGSMSDRIDLYVKL